MSRGKTKATADWQLCFLVYCINFNAHLTLTMCSDMSCKFNARKHVKTMHCLYLIFVNGTSPYQ